MTPALLSHKDPAKGTEMPLSEDAHARKESIPIPYAKDTSKSKKCFGLLELCLHGNISIWYLECTGLIAVDLKAVPVLEYCLLLSSGFSNNGAATGGAINHSMWSFSKYHFIK